MTADPSASMSSNQPSDRHAQEPGAIRAMFEEIAGRYDLANHGLSLGMDFYWRRVVARRVAGLKPRDILDVATGSGDLALALQRACPAARVTGADFCEPMLARARDKGLATTVLADALALPFDDGSFDVVTVAFGLRNMVDRRAAICSMARVLRPGGHLFILDFSLPEWRPMRWLYRIYLHRVLPLVAGILTGKKDAYQYLGASIEDFPSGQAMVNLISDCGLVEARALALTGGIVSLYSAERRLPR